MALVEITKTPYEGVFQGKVEIYCPIISSEFLIREDGEVDFYTPLSRAMKSRLTCLVNKARKKLKGEGRWVR